MANITEYIELTVYSDTDIANMIAQLQAFINLLPINASLTTDQRKKLMAIKAGNKVFVENVLSESLVIGPNILPTYIDLSNLETSLQNYNKFNELESHLSNALQRLQDAKRIAGHQAYNQSTIIYNSIKIASDAGVPNAKAAYTKLKERFTASKAHLGRKPDLLP